MSLSGWSNKAELRRMVITDRSQNPQNFLNELEVDTIEKTHVKLQNLSTSCTDNFDIYLLVKNNTIKDAKFNGEGCVISTTSTDFLLSELIDKKIDSAITMLKAYLALVETGKNNSKLPENLSLFDEVHKQANRIPCASNASRIILNYLQKIQGK